MAIVDNPESILFSALTTGAKDTRGIVAGAASPGAVTGIATMIAPGAGTAIGAVVDVVLGLFGGLKGATKHISFAEMRPAAENFEKYMYPRYLAAFGSQGCIKLFPLVVERFRQAQKYAWGPAAYGSVESWREVSLAMAAANANPGNPGPLSWLLFSFVIFVGCNVDAEADQASTQAFFSEMYDRIFVWACQDAGLDPAKISETKPAGTAAKDATGTGTTAAGFAVSKAGIGSIGIAVIVLIVLALLFWKG